jgi:hypothetical protein
VTILENIISLTILLKDMGQHDTIACYQFLDGFLKTDAAFFEVYTSSTTFS